MRRIGILIGLLAVMIAGVLASSATAAGTTETQGSTPAGGKLNVGVKITKFKATTRGLDATGIVSARLADSEGRTTVLHKKVTLTERTAEGSCKVLHLELEELDLTLLGLNAHLDKVILDVTGKSGGGVLGQLFCQLANSKVTAGKPNTAKRQALARRMTSQLEDNRIAGEALRLSALITPKATASVAGTCKVLDLIVGPLNLELLGLVVELNQVHLSVTAAPGQGALGDLFCSLAV